MTVKNSYFIVLFLAMLLFVLQKAPAQVVLPDTISNPVVSSDSLPILPSDSVVSVKDSVTVAAKDSVKSNAIDAPIQYAARDSMIMEMSGHNLLYLYGEGDVKYTNLNFTAGYIEVDADKKLVYGTYRIDSIGEKSEFPVFKQGDTQYEMDKAWYNFKSKKMYVTDVITQQGEGYVTARETKKMSDNELFMREGNYTTCDDHEHPHFYFRMTKAKVKPGKSIATGPAYLVVEDVPLPVAIPFGYFPFSSDYSSGIIMPTYGDEMARGFSLHDGGYYFAFNDYVDLALTGEIYTKGSWGLNARSTYRKRYKYSGNLDTGYLVTILGDKGSEDYSKKSDLKINWSHSQDPKANPFYTLSASVNFSTSSYNRNSLSQQYSNQYSDNTKSSSVNFSLRPPNSAFSYSVNMSVSQQMRDTSVSITLPNLTVTMRDVYPFKRKEQAGDSRWYENIKMRYTGTLQNRVNSKEYDLFQKNVLRDWQNGVKHDIPVSASFNLLKYITINPAVNYTERWYTSRIEKSYNSIEGRVVPGDTIYGFNRLYDFNGSVSANTKLYGMYRPWSIFGKTIRKYQIRHVLTPSVGFSGAPDFSDKKFGFYKELIYHDKDGKLVVYDYSPYEGYIMGGPSKGKTGSANFSLDNNLEMKVPVGEADSTKKISLIDNLRLSASYNFLADSLNWSDLNAGLRLKFSKSLNFNVNAVFDTYTYNEEGRKINVPRWKAGKGIGRLKTTGWSFSYSFNNESIKKLFGKSDKKGAEPGDNNPSPDDDSLNLPDAGENPDEKRPASLRKTKEREGDRDSNGYLTNNIVWSLNFNYSVNIGYDNITKFNKTTREYPYKVGQFLSFSGNINPTKAWGLNFNSNYDFEAKKITDFYFTISRQMHCWSMSASIRPTGPYQSYSFSIAVNSAMLKDLKYNQSTSSYDAMNWGE